MKSRTRSLRLCAAILLPIARYALHAQDAPPEPKDFSKTNSVTIFLGEDAGRRNRVSGQGLEHVSRGRDGRTAPENIQGVPCRSIQLTDDGVPKGYFVFTIDPTFKDRDLGRVRIDLEYFDGLDPQGGVFGVQYDAKGSDQNRALTVKQVLPNVILKGSGRWLKTTFHLKDAGFRNAQGGGSDFRLWASPPELSVSRVTLTLEPSEISARANAPLTLNAAGEAKLTDWNLQWDSGGKPSFSKQSANQNGTNALVIRAPGEFSVGSSRTVVLLAPGLYQFIGKVRTEGLKSERDENRGGVTLRISGRYTPQMITAATDWTPVTYDLTIAEQEYVELVCELRATEGLAHFDLDSMKLIRKTLPAAPAAVPPK